MNKLDPDTVRYTAGTKGRLLSLQESLVFPVCNTYVLTPVAVWLADAQQFFYSLFLSSRFS